MIVTQHRTFNFVPLTRGFDENFAIVLERICERGGERLRAGNAADANRGAERVGLDEDWVAKAIGMLARESRVIVVGGMRGAEKSHDRDSGVAQQAFLRLFAHSDRRSQYARANVRNAGKFEQALDCTVF